jgi:3-dehydroquinate dehydratase-2
MKILILNGPNLNFLGVREPDKYGTQTLADLENLLENQLLKSDLNEQVALHFKQSNHEGALIDYLQQAHTENYAGIIFNPAAYTHTSIALRDAIAAISVPVIEVHISNVHAREKFRHKSFTAASSLGQISGLGFDGYKLALNYFLDGRK